MPRRSTTYSSLVLILLLCVGCAHTRGGGAAARPVCMSVAEVAFIRKQISKCKGKVERCKLSRQQTRLDHQRDSAILKGELDSCAKKQRALLQRRCPSCALPWILVGMAGAGAVAAGAWAIYERFNR